MKLFLFVSSLLALKLAFAAESFEEKEENEVLANENAILVNGNEALVNNDSVINNFSSDLWVEIGKFLLMPQKELGLLNKAASYAVFQINPYGKFVSTRFGIQELFNLECEKDLFWFKNLMQVNDKMEIFRCVAAGFFDQKAFPNYKLPIARYIMRLFRSFPAEVAGALSTDESLISYFVNTLYEIEAYAEIIEIYKTFPRLISGSFSYVDLEIGTKLVKYIFNASEENLNQSVETLRLVLRNIHDETHLSRMLYCCILGNIPQEFYFDILPINFHLTLKTPFSGRHPKLSAEESERVYETLLAILEYNRSRLLEGQYHNLESVEQTCANYRILLMIGFKPEIGENFYEMIIKPGNFDFLIMRKFAIYALFSGRIELFNQIFNDERLGQVEDDGFLALNQYYFSGFAYGLQILELLPSEKRNAILENIKFLRNFQFSYNVVGVNFDENQILTINFRRNTKQFLHSVPETFEYVYDTKIRALNGLDILEVILRSNADLDTESFTNFFNTIVYCPFFIEALNLEPTKSLRPAYKLIKMFSQSQELYNLALKVGLKFSFESQIMAELFKENIIGAKFVVLGRFAPFQFLPLLSTRVQIENFESFMERSIADLFLIDALPDIEEIDPTYCYYKYRTLLHHLLNGPHRERLLGLDIPVFRRLLAREVNDSDALFLTEGLEPEVPPVNEGEAFLLADVPQQNDP